MRLAAGEWGDSQGPPVICLHGLAGHGRRYRRLAEERLPGYRVVGVDLRGHGRSTHEPPWGVEQHVRDLVDTADALEAGTAVWVGHSFGGRLVAELAARHPALVERAVLLDPAMHLPAQVTGERAQGMCADLSFASPDEAIEARLADGSLFTTSRATLEEEAAEHLALDGDGRWRWRYAVPAAIVAWSEMTMPSPPWPACPTLVVVGERSWIPVDVPEASNVEVVTVPGGHSVLWDDFDATASAIARFLDR